MDTRQARRARHGTSSVSRGPPIGYRGRIPSNIFLYGKSGVGKTAATRFLFQQLTQDAESVDGVDLHTIEVNCDGLNTSYQTAVRLVNELRTPDSQISNTGYPQSSVYNFLFQELDTLGGTVLIVLDVVDHIDDDSLLYTLPRARSNGDVENVRSRLPSGTRAKAAASSNSTRWRNRLRAFVGG